jgi:hypothetical protein
MKLYPKNYEIPTPTGKPETTPEKAAEVKGLIKAFVDKPCEYDTIIKHIEAEIGLGGISDVIALINEVRDEWHPVVIEEPMEK